MLLGSNALATDLTAMDKFLITTNSFESGFVQEVKDETGALLQKSTGRFVSRKPDNYLWVTTTPSYTELVSNGKKVWFFDKELEQVTVQNVKNSQVAPIVLLAHNTKALLEQFEITQAKPCDDKSICYLLKPKDDDADFSSVVLELNKESMAAHYDGKIRKITLKDQLLNTTTIEFIKPLANTKISDKTFNFIVPKGVDVVENP